MTGRGRRRRPTGTSEGDAHRRADDLFEAALEIPLSERAAWVERACATEPELLVEVRELLRAHGIPQGVLEADVGPLVPDVEEGVRLEQRRIGPYRVLRELGRGGMGVVYLAERDDGQFHRLVAIKLLRDSPDADELHERFTAERQILASLDHPDIAQLLDAGVTDGQLPYLVMEYVDGLPITTWCDRHRLALRERLQLFERACAAVHHAHRNLVIHRDLKPSNILVTQDGRVKLLDFGIAKLQNPGLTAVHVPVTRAHLRVMTPEYASPEQVRGEPLSTASDVYSLGVVLYELLAGRRPLDFDSHAPLQVAELVEVREPVPPSSAITRPRGTDTTGAPVAALKSIATARDSTPERLRRDLKGDLDAITMMALRKESSRRYGSADLLAEDVHRHLQGLPVLAHRGSRRYYVGKFLRRHRAAATVAAVATASILSGAALAFWQASIARDARDRADAARMHAEQALTESEAVTDFLVGLFEASDPAESRGNDVTAQDLLRRGTGRIEALSGQPLVQARVLEAVGKVYRSIGRQDEARAVLERELAIQRAQLGPEDIQVARTLNLLADVIRRQGSYPEAEARAEEALRIQEQVLGPEGLEVAATLAQLSGLAIYRGDHGAAETLSRRALRIRESDPAADDSLVSVSLVHLASVIRRVGKYEEAERHLRRAIAITERTYGRDHPTTAYPMNHLAYLLGDLDRLDEAESLLREVLDIRRRTSGPGHPSYAYLVGDLADVLARRGEHKEAVRMFSQEVELLRQIFGQDYEGVAPQLGRISAELVELGDLDGAETAIRDGLGLAARDVGEEHQLYADLLAQLSNVSRHQAHYDEAEQAIRRAILIRSRANGPDTRNVGLLRGTLGALLVERGRMPEAEAELTAALAIIERSRLREDDVRFQELLSHLVDLYESWGRSGAAAPYRARLIGS